MGNDHRQVLWSVYVCAAGGVHPLMDHPCDPDLDGNRHSTVCAVDAVDVDCASHAMEGSECRATSRRRRQHLGMGWEIFRTRSVSVVA